MKNFSTSVIIAAICVIVGLGILGFCRTLYSTTPVAVAATDVRAVDELIGEQVSIYFATGTRSGFGSSGKVRGLILRRRGEFLVVQSEGWPRYLVWCNLPNVVSIWLKEQK